MSKNEKRRYYNTAKALGYESVMPDIKRRIYAAETEAEVIRVMTTARHMM